MLMPSVSVRFYGALNDFLPAAQRQATLVCACATGGSVKDLLEALGVPHTEIDLIVVNDELVDFAYLVREGDRVAAYPSFQSFDLGHARLGPPPQAEPRFVADVHLGRLTAYLRLAGLDTKYRNDYSDHDVAAIAVEENRTLLTRDVGLLKRRSITRGYFLRETTPARQLVEVMRRFNLDVHASFTRCLCCNTPLKTVAKKTVEHLLPPRTREHYSAFSRCPTCARIYWPGSHYAHMRLFLDTALAEAAHGSRVDGPSRGLRPRTRRDA
jgi:uncharacterized protein